MSETYSPVFSDAFAFKSLGPRLPCALSITMPWCRWRRCIGRA